MTKKLNYFEPIITHLKYSSTRRRHLRAAMMDERAAATQGRKSVHDLLSSGLKIVDYLQNVELSGQVSDEVQRLTAK